MIIQGIEGLNLDMEDDVLVGYYVVLRTQCQALAEYFRPQISKNKLTSVLLLYNHWGGGVLFKVFTAK